MSQVRNYLTLTKLMIGTMLAGVVVDAVLIGRELTQIDEHAIAPIIVAVATIFVALPLVVVLFLLSKIMNIIGQYQLAIGPDKKKMALKLALWVIVSLICLEIAYTFISSGIWILRSIISG